jgi:hypothetical protein
MRNGYRVVICSPVGRKQNLSILFPMIESMKGWVDEYRLWMNCRDPMDMIYCIEFANKHPGWVKLIHGEKPYTFDMVNFISFYADCHDENTIYIKIDDDICYIRNIEGLVDDTIAHPERLFVYPYIVNNFWCQILRGQDELIPDTDKDFKTRWENDVSKEKYKIKTLARDMFIPKALKLDFCPKTMWGNGHYTVILHDHFLNTIHDTNRWSFPQFTPIDDLYCVSINMIAWRGSNWKKHNIQITTEEDESYFAMRLPYELGVFNAFAANTTAAHYSFYPQKEILDQTDILHRYSKLR